ncbi:MAG TPA: transposase, partial [Mesotoga infera]|nr:transposase [Mesotoga infera]
VVAELDDGRRTTLISSDTELSSEDIFLYYLNRWSIESYFKTAKQHFSLGKAGLSTEDGHKHWTILVILAYLIFNDLHRFILEKTKSETKRYKVFETIQRAISMLRSLLLEQVKIDFHLLDSCFRSPSLLPFYQFLYTSTSFF